MGRRWKLPIPRSLTRVTFEGPSIVHFQIFTDLGEVRMVNTLLPLKPFDLHTETVWMAERSVPWIVVHLIAKIAAGALEQDREVWESKTYQRKPNLVKGDGRPPGVRVPAETSSSFQGAPRRLF